MLLSLLLCLHRLQQLLNVRGHITPWLARQGVHQGLHDSIHAGGLLLQKLLLLLLLYLLLLLLQQQLELCNLISNGIREEVSHLLLLLLLHLLLLHLLLLQ